MRPDFILYHPSAALSLFSFLLSAFPFLFSAPASRHDSSDLPYPTQPLHFHIIYPKGIKKHKGRRPSTTCLYAIQNQNLISTKTTSKQCQTCFSNYLFQKYKTRIKPPNYPQAFFTIFPTSFNPLQYTWPHSKKKQRTV